MSQEQGVELLLLLLSLGIKSPEFESLTKYTHTIQLGLAVCRVSHPFDNSVR